MLADLRSDTVTRPDQGMLEAMFQAKVGDDVYGEDETVNKLEHKLAHMLGFEAGMFCPSGTMANQIAIKLHTQAMDELVCEENSHVYLFEGGGIGYHSAASVRAIAGNRGRLSAELIERHINPDDIHYARTSLVVLENTANKGGGSCYEFSDMEDIFHLCRLKKLSLHLDGARLFNAIVAKGDDPRSYGRIFDTASVCLSKGLGAPVGSVLLGSALKLQHARRLRKVFGGGMRQAGYLAAAGIYALDNNITGLSTDHQHAAYLGGVLSNLHYVNEVFPVETNIVIFRLSPYHGPEHYLNKLASRGVLASKFGSDTIRLVLHRDISPEMVNYTADVLQKVF